MAKKLFFVISPLSFLFVWWLSTHEAGLIHLGWFALAYTLIGIHDLYSHHNILRNYPFIGHFRYMLEYIRPEIQQYFIENNSDGRPFSREQRSVAYQRAKNVTDTLPFGTQQKILEEGYEYALHSLAPVEVDENEARIMVGNEQCTQPYSASRLNISAMSFGALGHTAIETLNWGAKMGNFYHNTGEGGLSPYHLKHGGDIVLQIGTANFGFRNKDGSFNPEKFKQKAELPQVKMIEIKISQGAKPSHGGLLPGAKVGPEIAEIRDIEVGQDCFSPAKHPSVNTPLELVHFIKQLRELSNGKPVGFKLCIGNKKEFFGICKAMLETKIYPDFITIDGAEGGTGAAPLEFSNRLGLTLNEGLSFVHNALAGIGIREHVRLIASGKVVSGFDLLCKFALGADICNSARAMMFSVGCIQARSCNTNHCPTGIATQDPARTSAVVPEVKRFRVKNFHDNTIKACFELMGAMGISVPNQLKPSHIHMRMQDSTSITYRDYYPHLSTNALIQPTECNERERKYFLADWDEASAEHF